MGIIISPAITSASDLTSGRVVIASGAGEVTDDADLSFSVDTLTATKIAATTFTGNPALNDAVNVPVGTTTGTKLGTATTQKLALWNATPIVQPANSVAINDVLVNMGARASGGTSNFTTTVKPPAGAAGAGNEPMQMTSGTLLTAATAGTAEYDGKVFYTSPVASARGVSPSIQFSVLSADFGLSNVSTVQSAFSASQDVFTLEASTSYHFHGSYFMTIGTTSHTVAMAFATGGGASITSMAYMATVSNQVINTVGVSGLTGVNTNAATVVTTASTTAGAMITFRGILRMNAGGTITPQIKFSAAPGGTNTMLKNSYICFYPIGTDTMTVVGNCA